MRPRMAKMRPKIAKIRPKRAKMRLQIAKRRPKIIDTCKGGKRERERETWERFPWWHAHIYIYVCI